jgi:hypothetical protein
MPKFSIYVPDDLWVSAQAAQPEAKPSPLVQTALRRLVDSESRKSYASLPADVLAERERVLAIVTGRARKSYVAGYRIGLMFIEEFPWDAIEDFQRVGWDIESWTNSVENYEIPVRGEEGRRWDFDTFWEYCAEGELESSLAASEPPTGAIREGFVDAFRDVLDEAMQTVRRVGSVASVADAAGDPDPADSMAKEEAE